MTIADAAAVLAVNLEEMQRRVPAHLIEERSGLTVARVTRILNAEPEAFPCPRELRAIAAALETTTRDLLTERC